MANLSLEQAMQRLEQSMAARAAQVQQQNLKLVASSTEPVSAENTIYGYTLFDARRRGRREYWRGQIVRLPDGQRLSYRGEALGPDDQAVWTHLLTLCRYHGGTTVYQVEFSPLSALKAMGWGASSTDCKRFAACLERMQASVLKVPSAQLKAAPELSLSMIEKCRWLPSPTGRSGRWRVWIAADILALFSMPLN